MYKRKKLSMLLILSIILFAVGFHQMSKAVAESNDFTVVYSEATSGEIDQDGKVVLETYLEANWLDELPYGNEIYLPSLRREPNWLLANLHYYANETDYQAREISNLMLVLMVETNEGWQAALSDRSEAADLLAYVPESELSETAKRTLFDHYPSPFKTVSTNIEYRLPWDKDAYSFKLSSIRKDNPGCTDNSPWHGKSAAWGTGSCKALDFAVIPVTIGEETIDNENIIAPVSGYIHSICKNTNGKQGVVSIKATDSNQIVGLWHLDQNTIPTEIKQGSEIKMGDYLGRMVSGNIDERNLSCPLISQGTHLHFVAPAIPFTIDGYTFKETENGVSRGEENWTYQEFLGKAMISSNQLAGEITPDPCIPPTNGNFVVTQDCKLNQDYTVHGDIIIKDGAELTINDDNILTIDLKKYKIQVEKDSTLLIKRHAKIQ